MRAGVAVASVLLVAGLAGCGLETTLSTHEDLLDKDRVDACLAGLRKCLLYRLLELALQVIAINRWQGDAGKASLGAQTAKRRGKKET